MVLQKLSQTFDFLKPTLYNVEKKVAARSIPNVASIPDRKKLADYKPVAEDEFDHGLWDAILKQHVVETDGTLGEIKGVHLIDYDALAKDTNFKAYLSKLENTNVAALPEPEQLAFWINAYNALCVSLLLNNWEKVQNSEGKYSINNLSEMGSAVWDNEAGIVGGKTVSLNDIEHKELRGIWDEPAVHGCIVCASASCPNLRKEAFAGSRVREQMDDQIRSWMTNESKGLELVGKKLYLSRIFLWFGDDFGGWDGLREWLPKYLEDGEAKTRIEKNTAVVRFFDYSWEMNRFGGSNS
eukprot:CAMPEP_0168781086 /NCGR_PEP_ID=MMETSP0725-20121227/8455_1 /TAXON_ID=265536 /ORGANISM="Amphiprora sp., Strain CCMP467" /LENGTH=296 /DNA_ID=CAMNT_0008830953 /DNA_START=138 /DNA_END=1028 /DNA_ORIENTATION=+